VPDLPIYIGELTIGVAAIFAVGEHWRRRPHAAPVSLGHSRTPWLVLLGLFAWALVRLLIGPSPSVDGLRDFAPYGYAVLALAAALRPPSRDVAWRVVFGGLVCHTAWVAAAHYSLLPGDLPALGRTSLFEIRADFDSAICGVTAAWSVYLAFQHRRLRWLLFLVPFALFNLVLVLRLLSRAGLLAGLVAFLLLGLVAAGPAVSWARQSLRHLVLATLVLLALLGGLATSMVTSATGARLVSTFDFNRDEVGGVGGAPGAGGTTKARLEAYDKVVRYTAATPDRLAVGVGFGPDFLDRSGAAPALEGTVFEGVRAPHNILLNSLARLGVLGLVLHLAVLVIGALMAARFFLGRARDSAGAVYAMLLVALPVAAFFGVILESPFAAIPYFWSFGWLASQATAQQPWRPARPARRRAAERSAA
jgi:hypothetical protein